MGGPKMAELTMRDASNEEKILYIELLHCEALYKSKCYYY